MATPSPHKVALPGLLMLLAIGAAAQQAADPDFDTTVEHPAYPQQGPTVAIDEAHSNFHTGDGRYRPFAELLRSDGYEVAANVREFAPGSLDGIDILVIANANAGNLVDSAFTEAECDVVRDWVRAGGSLLLIADHAPFGASAANLAERFGVSMGKGWVFDVTPGQFSTQLVFSQENGLLGRHPVTRGRDDSETVRVVKSFGGQSLGAPGNASGLLKLSDTAREVADTDALDAEAAAYEGDSEDSSPGDHSSPVTGRVQGLAMRFGQGRIAVFGEAAMFSAQVVTLQGPNGPVTISAGMNVDGYDNRQFALNLLHWLSGLLGSEASASAHDKSWWHVVIADDYAPPPGGSMDSLLLELNGYLASPDPELRDDIAYGVLTSWLYVKRIVPPEERRKLIGAWRENLESEIGDTGTDSVFLRSFSALMLSVATALDNESPYLDAGEFDRLLASALQYLQEERDTRGFDPERGWIHSVAHTADLLKFLGRSRHLEVQDQSAIMDAVAGKLGTLDRVLVHGEDERLARAVLSIVARPDADMTSFETFLDKLRPSTPEGLPTPAELALNQNRRHLLVSLYAILSTDERDLESLREARVRVLAALKRF